MNLANIDFWRDNYGKSKDDFDDATSDLIHMSTLIDFDPDRMRGRGAWSEPDGRICYHDGKITTGEFSTDRIYLRRVYKNIGIKSKQATAKQRKEIANASECLTF